MIRKVLRAIFCFAWISCLIFRLDLLQAYGKGTGKNRLSFSPFDVAMFTSIEASRLRGKDDVVRSVGQLIGVPGELFRNKEDHLQSFNLKKAYEDSFKWTKDNKMKLLLNKKDSFSGLAAIGAVASVFLAIGFPKEASLLFVISLIGLQTSLRVFEPSVKINEEIGMYSIGFAAATYFF